jgi:hypothetical protein
MRQSVNENGEVSLEIRRRLARADPPCMAAPSKTRPGGLRWSATVRAEASCRTQKRSRQHCLRTSPKNSLLPELHWLSAALSDKMGIARAEDP